MYREEGKGGREEGRRNGDRQRTRRAWLASYWAIAPNLPTIHDAWVRSLEGRHEGREEERKAESVVVPQTGSHACTRNDILLVYDLILYYNINLQTQVCLLISLRL